MRVLLHKMYPHFREVFSVFGKNALPTRDVDFVLYRSPIHILRRVFALQNDSNKASLFNFFSPRPDSTTKALGVLRPTGHWFYREQ